MNSRQKRKKQHLFYKANKKTICKECGKPGLHYVTLGKDSLTWMTGFWTCDKFYDPVTKKRFDSPEPVVIGTIWNSLFNAPNSVI